MTCKCGSERIISVSAKCSDMFNARQQDTSADYDGYVRGLQSPWPDETDRRRRLFGIRDAMRVFGSYRPCGQDRGCDSVDVSALPRAGVPVCLAAFKAMRVAAPACS